MSKTADRSDLMLSAVSYHHAPVRSLISNKILITLSLYGTNFLARIMSSTSSSVAYLTSETSSFGTDWKPNTDACLANIKKVYETYGKEVMICETGMPVTNPDIAKEMLSYLLEKTQELECCKGVFYWEPQAPNGYNDGYGLGAFQNGKPTAALDPFNE